MSGTVEGIAMSAATMNLDHGHTTDDQLTRKRLSLYHIEKSDVQALGVNKYLEQK
jgi:hypothetical protein